MQCSDDFACKSACVNRQVRHDPPTPHGEIARPSKKAAKGTGQLRPGRHWLGSGRAGVSYATRSDMEDVRIDLSLPSAPASRLGNALPLGGTRRAGECKVATPRQEGRRKGVEVLITSNVWTLLTRGSAGVASACVGGGQRGARRSRARTVCMSNAQRRNAKAMGSAQPKWPVELWKMVGALAEGGKRLQYHSHLYWGRYGCMRAPSIWSVPSGPLRRGCRRTNLKRSFLSQMKRVWMTCAIQC